MEFSKSNYFNNENSRVENIKNNMKADTSGIPKFSKYKESYLINEFINNNYDKLFKFSEFKVVNKFVCRLCLEKNIIYYNNFDNILKNYIKYLEDCGDGSYKEQLFKIKESNFNPEELFLINLFYKNKKNMSIPDNKIKVNICEYSETVDLSNKKSIKISWNSFDRSYNEGTELKIIDALVYSYKLGFSGKVYLKYIETDFHSDWNITSHYELFYDDCDMNSFLLYAMRYVNFDILRKKIGMFNNILPDIEKVRRRSTTDEKIKNILGEHYSEINNLSFNDYALIFSKLFKNQALEFIYSI